MCTSIQHRVDRWMDELIDRLNWLGFSLDLGRDITKEGRKKTEIEVVGYL